MTSEIQALISEMREAAILTGQSGSTPIGYRVQQWADRLSTLTATTPEIQALVTELERWVREGPPNYNKQRKLVREAAAALGQQAQLLRIITSGPRASNLHPLSLPGRLRSWMTCGNEALAADLEEAAAQLARVTAEREKQIEIEASACPEDVGAAEYVPFLQRKLEAAEAALSEANAMEPGWLAKQFKSAGRDIAELPVWAGGTGELKANAEAALSAHREALERARDLPARLREGSLWWRDGIQMCACGHVAGSKHPCYWQAGAEAADLLDRLAALASPKQELRT